MISRSEQRKYGPVTVGDVLELDALVDAGIQVVAGAQALDREVSWVHAGEIADIASFLRPGDLLLTAGTGIRGAARDQRSYIEALHQAGASAIILEYGRAFREVPEVMREAAEAVELPFATLQRTVAFAEVTRAVHAWIIGRRYAMQNRAESMALEFNELLLSGGTISQVLAKLHELTGKAALLEDSAHQLIEYTGPPDELDAIVDQWSEHSRFGHSGSREAQADAEELACAWAPVTLRDEQWGRIHIVGGAAGVDEFDTLAAARASSAVGLALLSRRSSDRLAERTRSDLLAELERRAPQHPATFLRQARSLGANFRGCNLVALRTSGEAESVEEADRTAGKRANTQSIPLLRSMDTDGGRLLLGIAQDRDAGSVARAFAESLVPAPGSPQIAIGISRATSVPGLQRAFHEANEVLRFTRVSGAVGALEYSKLGLHLLLASLSDGPELASFVEAELGPLLDYDAKHRSPLLPTLRALLAHDSNRAAAARELHVERRSLYYRIERIEQVLDQSLDEHNVKLGLSVALRALSLIEDRPTARRD